MENPPPRSSTIEAWLASRRAWILALLVVGALLVRIVCFLELNAGPCLHQHRWEQSDMHFFVRWAGEIAAGDLLTNQAMHPRHRWHAMVAEQHFAAHPEDGEALAREAEARGDGTTASELLWHRWWRGTQFHQEPLYPYLIAATAVIAGPDVRWVLGWQMLVGAASAAIVFLIGRRAFGDCVGAAAGVMAVLCGPLVYYDMVLLRASLLVVASLLLVHLTMRAFERDVRRDWFILGLVGGLALLVKTTFALYGLGLAVALVWRQRRRPRRLLAILAAGTAGFALAIVPLVARNVIVAAPALSASSVAATTFAQVNGADYDPDASFFIVSGAVPAIMGRTGGAFLPTVIETLRTHDSVRSYAGHVWSKLLKTWRWYEIPNNACFDYFRLHSRVLRVLPVTALAIMPLGTIGLVLAAGRWRTSWPLLLLAASLVVPLLLFDTTGRYRAPLLAGLLPCAALTIVWTVSVVRARRYRTAAGVVLALAALTAVTARPLPDAQPRIRPTDHGVAYEVHYAMLEEVAVNAGDWRGAADALGAAMREIEPVTARLDALRPATTAWESELAGFESIMRERRAACLDQAGDAAAAQAERARARALDAAVRARRGFR